MRGRVSQVEFCCAGGAGCWTGACCCAAAATGTRQAKASANQRIVSIPPSIFLSMILPEDRDTSASTHNPCVEPDAKRAIGLNRIGLGVIQHPRDAETGSAVPVIPGDVAEHTHLASGRHRGHAAARHGERDAVAQLPVNLVELLLHPD